MTSRQSNQIIDPHDGVKDLCSIFSIPDLDSIIELPQRLSDRRSYGLPNSTSYVGQFHLSTDFLVSDSILHRDTEHSYSSLGIFTAFYETYS